MASTASRDTRSCSRPAASTCATSAIAGVSRNRRIASMRGSSRVTTPSGNCASQPSWRSISPTNWLILADAACACSFWMETSSRRCSRYENHASIVPFTISAAAAMVTNEITYFQNSRPRGATGAKGAIGAVSGGLAACALIR
jgi:hypothetical protein